MTTESELSPQARSLVPSRSVVGGAFGGAAIATFLEWAGSLAGITVPHELALPAGAFIAALVAYFVPGGRKGEPV